MAVNVMVSKERWEESPATIKVVTDYPGCKAPLYMGTSWVGKVLWTGEHNWHDDSDFYAVVWDEEQGEPREVEYASTRGWTYPNSASVDATPEVVAAYDAWKEAKREAERKAAEEEEAKTPRKGRRVRVVKGRNVPVGTEGTVVWYGEGKYFGPRPRYRNGWSCRGAMRVGVKDAAGTVHWTAASNVDVVR